LRVAAEQFEKAILELDAAIQSLTKGDADTNSEANKLAKTLAATMSAYFTEKQKIENSNRNQRGIVYDYAIDFASARAEIAGRMASLRAAADPTSLSE